MTVSSTADRESFPGNGTTTVFPLPFRFFEDSDVTVSLIEDATGTATPQIQGVHYSLAGAGEPEQSGMPASVLTMFTAPATGFTLFAMRDMAVEQQTDIQNQGAFFPEVHENVFDRLVMLIQQYTQGFDRALRVQPYDPIPNRIPGVAQRVDRLLSFDSLGNPIAVAPVAGTATALALLLADQINAANGSGMIGHRGMTLRAYLDSLSVSPRNFGADPTGVADSAAAIQAAINSGAPVIDGGGGTYKILSALTLRSNMTLQNMTLDASSMAAGSIIITGTGQITGPFSVPSPTGFAGAGLTVALTTAEAANFATNDYMRLRADNVFDSFNTNSKVGEIQVVAGVDYGTGIVTSKTVRQNAYTASANRFVEKLSPINNVRLSRVKVRGAAADQNNMIAMQISYGNRVIIDSCEFERFDSRCVYFLDSVNCHVLNSSFKSARPATSGYGVSFADASQDCTAIGNYFEDVRHSLSTNNTSARGGVVRRIVFQGNTVFCSARALGGSMGGGDAIDTHGAAENISIIGNTVFGSTGSGINVECCGATIMGNILKDCDSNGISVHNESDFPGNFIIDGNTVNDANGVGINMTGPIRGSTVVDNGWTVSNNTVNTTTGNGINLNSTSSPQAFKVSATGNTVRNATLIGMFAHNIRQLVINGNVIESSGVAQNGLRLSEVLQFTVTGNTLLSPASSTVPIVQVVAATAGSSARGIISSNVTEPSGSSTTSSGIALGANAQYVGVYNNVMRNTGGLSLGGGTGVAGANNIT